MSTQEHVFSDDEALNWLRTQPDGQTAATITALAQEWRWTRNKVSKRLNQWMSDGLIARTPGRDRRWIISAVSASVLAPALPVPRPVVADDVERAEPTIGAAVSEPMVATGSMVAPMVASEPMVAPVVASPPVPLVDRAEPVPLVDRAAPARFEHARIRRPFPLVRMVTSLVLAALAAAIAWFGIRINAWYGATLGRTAEASMLLAGLSVSADVLAFTLPVAARTLWIECRHAASALAWGLWTIVTAIALLATIGFAALNIADTTAARGKVVDDVAVLAARGERLRAERASITETRSVATIEAELQRAQPGAIAVWRATDGCRDVTLPESGKACATVLSLRQALGAAQRRDLIDADLRAAETEHARLPAITSTDPQAETAARLIQWATLGAIKLTKGDIEMARIAGMSLMPQIAGLVLMLAGALWPSRRAAERTSG